MSYTQRQREVIDRYEKIGGPRGTGGYDGHGTNVAYMAGFLAGGAAEREGNARIAERCWHESGTECTDRENCGIYVHNRYAPDQIAKLIRLREGCEVVDGAGEPE